MHIEASSGMDKQNIIKVARGFSSGVALGVGVISSLFATYFIAQDFSNNHIQTKSLFYLITGISCIYLGLRFKWSKN